MLCFSVLEFYIYRNSIFIGILNLLLLKLGPKATAPEMLALITGGPLGTMFAMWMHDKYFFADSDSAKSMAKTKHQSSDICYQQQ